MLHGKVRRFQSVPGTLRKIEAELTVSGGAPALLFPASGVQRNESRPKPLEGASKRALGRDTSALPLTRSRSGALPEHRTASFPIHYVKQRSLLRSRRALLRPGS